jgi:phage baseplate assembly protein V
MKKLIMECVQRALAGLRLAYRARLTARADGAGVQLLQGDALAGETMQAAELFQHFGFTSAPPAGTQLIVLPLGGQSAHSVVIATENGSYRVDVQSGEACVYNMWSDKIHLKQERIEVETKTLVLKAAEQVIFETPSITMQGTGGGAAAASMTGSLHITGGITSDADIVAQGISHTKHEHPGDSGGITGPPIAS